MAMLAKEAAAAYKAARAARAAGHFRRFAGYDYSRGGSLFITTTLAERRPLFGRVEHDHVVLSAAGEILAAQIERVKREFPRLTVRSLVIMPDHLHIRLTFPPGLENPTADIGNFVGRIKQYSQYYIVYRPKGDEPRLFDQGRLLLLSRQVATEGRYEAWHGINAALGAVARAKGDDLYVRPDKRGVVRWLFNEQATAARLEVLGRGPTRGPRQAGAGGVVLGARQAGAGGVALGPRSGGGTFGLA